jgi:hypothetical protein
VDQSGGLRNLRSEVRILSGAPVIVDVNVAVTDALRMYIEKVLPVTADYSQFTVFYVGR